jgi:CRP-like cAMP-binding protein
MYELLFKHFNRHVSLTPEEFEECLPFFQFKRFRKHQYILQEGDISRNESFVLKGCTRSYEVDEKGQEHIIQFGVEDWWVGDMYSFLTRTPARTCIDCIEECEVLQISEQNHDAMLLKMPKLERHFRKLISAAYCASINRIYSSLSKPALERYQEFIRKYPEIEQRVPNHYIASYLGITPQSLSRVRAQNISKRS